jgi:hypothetical protein
MGTKARGKGESRVPTSSSRACPSDRKTSHKALISLSFHHLPRTAKLGAKPLACGVLRDIPGKMKKEETRELQWEGHVE